MNNWKVDERPKRGSWAPGGYTGKCRLCGEHYMGDKRSQECADCAYTDWYESYQAERTKNEQLQAKLYQPCKKCEGMERTIAEVKILVEPIARDVVPSKHLAQSVLGILSRCDTGEVIAVQDCWFFAPENDSDGDKLLREIFQEGVIDRLIGHECKAPGIPVTVRRKEG